MDGNYYANTASLIYYILETDKSLLTAEQLGNFVNYLDSGKDALENSFTAYSFFRVAEKLLNVPIARIFNPMVKSTKPLQVKFNFQNILDKEFALDSSSKVIGNLYDSSRKAVAENISFSPKSKDWFGTFPEDTKPGNYKIKLSVTHANKTYIVRLYIFIIANKTRMRIEITLRIVS